MVMTAIALQAGVALAVQSPAHSSAAPRPSLEEAGFLTAAADTQASVAAAVRVDRGARTRQRATTASTPATRAVAVAAANINNSDQHGNLLTNFDGTGSLDSGITNFGAEFEPPDQGLCVGNGFVVDMVNSAYRVYNTKGVSLAGPFNINKVFHDGFTQFTSDPRCYFDASTHTWFAVILFLNDTFTASRLEIAVTGDPTKSWRVFKIDTTRVGGNGCPCFGDQPTLGIDGFNIYVTTNEFSINGPPFAFNGAQIYAIDKNDLVANAKKVHFVHFRDLSIGGALAGSVQPALTTGSPGAEYFLSSLDPNGLGDNRIGVWALTNASAVGEGDMPTLTSKVINSEAYSIPPAAMQKGSTSLLDAGDDRMQQVQFIGGSIWGALDTSLQPAGDAAARAGIAWFKVTPRLSGSKLGNASIEKQGYIQSKGEYLLYPAIQADSAGRAAVVFTLTSAKRFASAAYDVTGEESSNFGRPVVAAAGTGPYDPLATRWGDYSWAVLDPVTDSVWMATEYIPPPASQTTDGLRNWGTRVLQVSLAD